MRCFFKSCEVKPSFYCSCEKTKIICEEHLVNHMKDAPSIIHQIFPLYKKIREDEEEEIIASIRKMIKKTSKLRNELVKTTNALLNYFESLMIKLNEMNAFFFKNIKEIIKNKRVIVPPCKLDEDSKILYLNNPIGVEEIKILIKDSIYYFEIRTSQIDYDNFIDKQSNFIEKISDLINNNEISENDLFYSKPETKSLIRFVTQTQNFENIPFSIPVQGFNASICKIDKNILFITGGYIIQKNVNSYLSETYLLNLRTKKCFALAVGIKFCKASCEYFKNKVYVFGGYNGSSFSESRVYDFIQSEWSYIQPLPIKAHSTSTLLLDSNILVTAKSLYLYNTLTNNYKEITIGQNISDSNILINYGMKVILLYDNYVYESFEIINSWKSVKSSASIEVVNSKPYYRGKYAYFLVKDGNIYRYNCIIRSGRIIYNY